MVLAEMIGLCGSCRTARVRTIIGPLVLLLLAAANAQASVVGPVVATQTQIVTTTNGGGLWTVQPPAVGNCWIYRSADGQGESRYVFEFPSLGVTGPVHVNSATFRFSIPQISFFPGILPMDLNFYGYGDADGTTTVADALKVTRLVASAPQIDSGDTVLWNVSLDASFVESVINGGGRVGLVGMAAPGELGTVTPYILTIYADKSMFGNEYPALTVDYTRVPEPTAFSLLALGGLVMLRRRTRR